MSDNRTRPVALLRLGLLLLPRPNRYLWWLPCSGLAVGAVVLLVGNHLIDLGAAADRSPHR